ncbi:MAG TPA: hypothetical protein VJP80_02000 [Candidatus Saccharimonadales bacterium]|nr:hypothetical protein [Candidatus Saccharimonadales bacterium]
MSELDGGVSLMPERIGPTPFAELEQMHGAGVVPHLELADYTQAQGYAVAQETNTNTGIILPEMPPSHDKISPDALTPAVLIGVCKHFAEIAARNPALAERMAKAAIQVRRQEVAMQRTGLDRQSIESHKWSSMRTRHQGKIKEKVEAQAKPEPASELAPTEPAPAAVIAPAVVAEAISLSPVDKRAPPRAIVHMDERRNRRHNDRPVEATPSSTTLHNIETASPRDVAVREVILHAVTAANPDYVSPPVAVINAIKESVAMGPVAPPEDMTVAVSSHGALPEQPPFNDPTDIAEILAEQVSTPSLPYVAVPNFARDEATEQINIAAVPVTPEAYIPTQAQGTQMHETEPQEPTLSWNDVLEETPLEFYDDFTGALQALIALPEGQDTGEVGEFVMSSPEAQQAQLDGAKQEVNAQPELETVPPIATAVAERLHKLDDEKKGTVALLLQSIVVSVQASESLSVEKPKPEIAASALAQLEEQVVALFEALGIAYDAESVTQFMGVLLRADFQPSRQRPVETAFDLEHQGTHEIKRHFAQIARSSFADIEYEAQRVLGGLVLLHSPVTALL